MADAENNDPAKEIVVRAIDYDRADSKADKERVLKDLAGLVTAMREANMPDGDAMKDALIKRDGMECQGCGFEPPGREHLQLDHKVPKTDGGSDIIDNRILLCGPCNTLKSNKFTLSGLHNENRKAGRMVNDLGTRRKSQPAQPDETKANAGADGEGGDWNEPGISSDQKLARVFIKHGAGINNDDAFRISGVSPKDYWRPGHARAVAKHAPGRLREVARGEISLNKAYEIYGRQSRKR